MEKRRHNTRHAAALAAAAATGDPFPASPGATVSKQGLYNSPALTGNGVSHKASESSSLSVASSSASHTQSKSAVFHLPNKSASTQEQRQSCGSKMASKRDMYEDFQAWAMKTYGDSAKTKTVTRRKYNRILKILKGEEQTNAENSKFRFWVKAKGFRIGAPIERTSDGKKSDQVIYIPCSKAGSSSGEDSTVYKKVAVVENFFDIIYGVHVEMDGRGGKHAGQKRTYKAIAEMYSFLPREAVTHFLMSCADCQKRMHLGSGEGGGGGGGSSSSNNKAASCSSDLHDNAPTEQQEELSGGSELSSSPDEEAADSSSLHIDYSLPITTTYLKHMKSLGYSEEDALNPDREDSEDAESEVSEDPNITSAQTVPAESYDVHMEEVPPDEPAIKEATEAPVPGPSSHPLDMRQRKHDGATAAWRADEPLNMTKSEVSNNHQDHAYDRTVSPCNGCSKREASATPDDLSAGTKDEDDDDEDDDGDKIDSNKYDPERLKAFNMFVRLFVDENLDRMVPISRQPKDKIQAIIDSCARQFPEFGERARKRIRTYLKSCRRNKRTRENSTLEIGRSTHPHLTSALAEQILAAACENESQNAKRMRLGLKPIAAEADRARHTHSTHAGTETESKPVMNRSPHHENILQATLRHGRPSPASATTSVLNGSLAYAQASSSYNASSSSPYRLVPNATNHATAAAQSTSTENQSALANGPTDLSMKKCSGNPPNKALKYSLNPSEVAAVKQLIAGYRESAAFLLRSADELEQLLLQQN